MALAKDQPQSWASHIPTILFAFRNSTSASTGYTPFQLMFGRDPIDDLDVMFPSPARKRELLSNSEYAQSLATRIEQAHHMARENMGLAVHRQRRNYQRQPKQFEVNDWIWLFTPTLGSRGSTKMSSNWSGPWLVTRKENDLVYEIEATDEINFEGRVTVSIDRMRLYLKDLDYPCQLTENKADLHMTGNEMAQAIPGHDRIESERKKIDLPIEQPNKGGELIKITTQAQPDNFSPLLARHSSKERNSDLQSKLDWNRSEKIANWSAKEEEEAKTCPESDQEKLFQPDFTKKLDIDHTPVPQNIDSTSDTDEPEKVKRSTPSKKVFDEPGMADRRARYEARTGKPRMTTPEHMYMRSTRPLSEVKLAPQSVSPVKNPETVSESKPSVPESHVKPAVKLTGGLQAAGFRPIYD